MATILIVDDVAANRAKLSRVLQGKGHRLLDAPDSLGQKLREVLDAEAVAG